MFSFTLHSFDIQVPLSLHEYIVLLLSLLIKYFA